MGARLLKADKLPANQRKPQGLFESMSQGKMSGEHEGDLFKTMKQGKHISTNATGQTSVASAMKQGRK